MWNPIYKFGLFLIIYFSSILFAQTGWYSLPTPPSSSALYGVFFKDANTGVVYIWKTINGGQNWIQSTNAGGYCINFYDMNTGYLIGSGAYKTTNCGDNWTSLPIPAGGSIMYSADFPDINTGYLSGATGKIVKTTNGGSNWTNILSGVSSLYTLQGNFFVDINTGYVCGWQSDNSSVILKTIDGGSNWATQNFSSGRFNSIFFMDINTGIVIGQKIYRTTDAGNNWNEITTSVSIFSTELYFPSQNTGYCSGFGGTIIKTTDAGLTWFRQTTGTSSHLESIYFINDNTGYACGQNGKVLKTTDGGGPPFGIISISTEIPEKLSLSQNYPNPFNPVTNINFGIPQKSFVKIIVYDAAGKVIDQLVNFELNAGTYKVDWQADDFPSGVYFYSLQAGNYKESKKMIMLK